MKKINCILLVDDNESDNFFHQEIIRQADVCTHLKVVTDGIQALNYIVESRDSAHSKEFPKPDVIFLDINMPRMNGFEFLEEYDKLEHRLKSTILIIMLSTSLIPRDQQKAMEIEVVNEFINKPLTEEMLWEIVEKYF
jgi:CheY-like chemotaxis protein